jgi:NADH:ubiquinone oxidoreductase subunit K
VLIFLCLYLLIGINFILLNILLFGKLQSDKVVPVLIALIVLAIACVVFVLSFKKIMTYYRKKEKAIIEKEQILSVEIAVKEEQGDTLKDEV